MSFGLGFNLGLGNKATNGVLRAISNLTATPRDTFASLSWTAPADGGSPITSYTVEYKLSTEPTIWTQFGVPSLSTSVDVTGLTNETSYDFRVTTTNALGTSISNTATSFS